VRVLEQLGMPHGNPVLTHDERGTLTCFFAVIPGDTWEEAELRSSTSRDGGRTWSAPRAWPGPAHAPQDGTVPATKPLWLGKTLLLPLNGESFAPEPQRQWYSFFRRSEDGGATWQESAPIFTTPGNIQPSVLHLGGERLLAFLRPRGLRSKIWRSTSEDAGRTWSTPERTDLDTPSSRNDAVRLPSGAIVIAWNDSPTERTPLVLALSKDGGRTFPVRRVVERGPIVYGYSALIAGADGRVHLVYNHNLEAIGHVAVDEAWFTAPPNPAPTVELDRALGGRVHRGPLSARVEAQDADGIARLELLLGHRVLAARQESAGDGNGAWTAKVVLPPGRHALRARATDRRGGVAYTPLTYLTVAR
jgi:predicted neuraminidase